MAGETFLAGFQALATVWDTNGTPTELGTLGGTFSFAQAINNSGQVASRATLANGQTRATVWDADCTPTNLGTLGGISSIAQAINNSGQVAGRASLANNERRATVWDSNGTPTNLGTLGGTFSAAVAINDSGQVAGEATASPANGGQLRATRWDTDGNPTDLGALGGEFSTARAINDSGQVAGNARPATGGLRAIVWDADGTPTNLGTLGSSTSSQAWAINDLGFVVGDSGEAFFWSEDLGMISLFDSLSPEDQAEWQFLNVVFDINELGQIVGSGTNAAGQGEAFILTPIFGPDIIPEPSTYAALFGVLALGLAVRRRRRQVTA
ncbi:MAG: PEP-CTERM sorting domain-containing protein [Opitutales bacterium]